MKKFLIISMLVVSVGFTVRYWVYYRGFFLPSGEEAEAVFTTRGKEICVKTPAGTWTSLALKGVDVSSSLPGQPASMFAPGESDYLRWLEQIGQMGANTVRVYTIMDPDFYNAFYTYNTTHSDPLYLMQGLLVSDWANYAGMDAYEPGFYDRLVRDGKSAVDIMHGRKSLFFSQFGETSFYRKDISPWVLGYLVGNEWSADTIAYTDHSSQYSAHYSGLYFQTGPEATPFEAMLARVMDQITGYESRKYAVQRLIGFMSAPNLDFLVYQDLYARQLGKYCFLNGENVRPTQLLKSGYFAAYQLFDFCDDFVEYLAPEQIVPRSRLTSGLKTDVKYGGYLELLSRYHTIPLVACYGISSARGVLLDDQQPLTEKAQGQALMEIYRLARQSGWTGGCISTWQDVWEKRSWNTAYTTELTRNTYWHDLQSQGQNNGLMAFDPGKEGRTCIIDGDFSEWAQSDVVLREAGRVLSAKIDEEGLYLLIQAENPEEKTWIVPLDITPDSGSVFWSQAGLHFQRPVDLILQIDGRENSRLLVREYQDPVRANFLQQINGKDPFVTAPDPDSDVFVPVSMPVKNTTLKTKEQYRDVVGAEKIWELKLVQTGLLHHGNGNPRHPQYDSLSDFCFGEHGVEVRLPWQLLNFSDPSQGAVHTDYYRSYAIHSRTIRQFWVGLSGDGKDVNLYPIQLEKWGSHPRWHERLKQSYKVIQRIWKEA